MQTKWHWAGDEVTVENARIVYLNFEGHATKFKDAGHRQFTLVVPDELAEEMLRAGWNVRRTRPREVGDPGQAMLDVGIGFKYKPPRIVMITETTKKRTILDEELCGLLDDVDFAVVDITLRPRAYEVSGRKGIKAYLKTIFAIIREDYLELKYENWGAASPRELESAARNADDGKWPVGNPDYWDAEIVDEQDGIPLEGGR